MKNTNIRILPTGLKGNQIDERMKELMGIGPINENVRTSVVELTKMGPDDNIYAIVRENHEYYIKIAPKKEKLVAEDFKYIGGLQNKKSESYPSYSKAIKHLNLKFNSLNESLGSTEKINVFENDNILNEAGFAGFSEMKGSGFSGEGNLEGNKDVQKEDIEPEIDSLNAKNPVEEEEKLSDTDKAVDDMIKEDTKAKNNPWAICTASTGREDKEKYEHCVKDVKKEKGIDENITEDEYTKGSVIKENHKLSINRALEEMDSIIDTLDEKKVIKKKVYSLK
jgi:hypothetical protein